MTLVGTVRDANKMSVKLWKLLLVIGNMKKL